MEKGVYAFFGVDGVGKTTTIEGVKKRLEDSGKKVLVFRMNRAGGHRLPFLTKFMKMKARYLRRRKGVVEGDKKIPLVNIYRKRGLLFLIIYYLDLRLRYNEIKKLSKDNIILLDRYFYDGLALTNQRWLPFFSKITPKPGKSFFLWAPPEVVLKRKQEATKQNMIDYTKRVEEDFTKYFDITKVDTSKPLNKVLDRIESEIKKNG